MGKNAVVFGATSGIGMELAKLLVKNGYKVMITGRRVELLEALRNEDPSTSNFNKILISRNEKKD